MSTNHADAQHNPLLEKLVAEFPAVHQPADCLAAARRIGRVFGPIVYPERDWSLLDGERGASHRRNEANAYTLEQANDFASKPNYADAEHKPLLEKLVVEFPAVHQPADCMAAALRIGGGFGRIVYPERDWSVLDGERGASHCRNEANAYTVEQADDFASKIRALVSIDEPRAALDTRGIVSRLVPEIRALQKRGYTLARVAETLTSIGVEITEVVLAGCLEAFPEPSPL